MDGRKVGEIWWRVSTDDQKEISPDTQTGAAMALAERGGYIVPPENIIGTDWHSLSVWESPPMERLKALIRARAIAAVFMYDADRGPSKPVHRLLFRALCEENGVVVRCCHGEIPGGEMGEVMEFLSAWAKEKQVNRAQRGAKDGLRDRARIKGLPVNGKPPYGYRFRYELHGDKKIPVGMEPEPSTHSVAASIWQMAVDGAPLRGICRQLIDQGIPSPRGGTWSAGTLYNLIRNPIYGGRYYALRHEAIVPQRRKKLTYGNSSQRHVPRDQWYLLEDFIINEPVVSWLQWEAVQERLHQNKVLSPRNSKRFYLLSGILFCEEDGRRLCGLSKKNGKHHYYACTLRAGAAPGKPPCSHKRLRGADVEQVVWANVSAFLSNPRQFMAEVNRKHQSDGGADVLARIEQFERKLDSVDAMDTELLGLRLRGQASDVAFERQRALLRAERSFYNDELKRQREALATLRDAQATVDSLEQMYNRILGRLESATPQDRRWVLQALNTRVTVRENGIEISLGIPSESDSISINSSGLRRYASRCQPWDTMTSP